LFRCSGSWIKERDCECSPDGKSCYDCSNPKGRIGDTYCSGSLRYTCYSGGWKSLITCNNPSICIPKEDKCDLGCDSSGKTCAVCKPGIQNGWYTCKICNEQGSGWTTLAEGSPCTANGMNGKCDKNGNCVTGGNSKCTTYTYPEGLTVPLEGYEGEYMCRLASASSSLIGGWWYNLLTCQNGNWRTVKSCWVWQCDAEHKSCGDSNSNYKFEDCTKKPNKKACVISGKESDKYSSQTTGFRCKFGQGEDANCLVGNCEQKVISSIPCLYGCTNGECNPAPQPPPKASIEGQVTDANNGLPVQFAYVDATTQKGPFTARYVANVNSQGYYHISNLDPGIYTVTAGSTFYKESSIVLTLNSGTTTFNFALFKK